MRIFPFEKFFSSKKMIVFSENDEIEMVLKIFTKKLYQMKKNMAQLRTH